MKTKKDKPGISRRDFIRKATFLGSTPLLSGGLLTVFKGLAEAKHLAELDQGKHDYPHSNPENVIYSACLQCHTACPIKCKVVDGVLVKIDGNPYCPQTNLPNLPYASTTEQGALKEGKICPKGQAGIETLYDPYRIRQVLKRKPGTKRGGDQWVTIDFNQAIDEIVNGGDLFGEGHVEGLKDIYALRDRKIAKALARDVKKIQKKEMSVSEFKKKHAKHLKYLIDPNHPDLGPKNNQFVFLAGRIEHGRKELAKKWFTQKAFGSVNEISHESICEWSHHIAYEEMTRKWDKKGKWGKGKHHMKPDLYAAEFVLFFGTGFADANFGPPLLSGLVSNGKVERGLKIAVVDPRLSRSAGKADWWIPIKPGADAAFALGMTRWMLDNNRYDKRFLMNANKAAAQKNGETSWTTASYLVKIVKGQPEKYLRASEVGIGSKKEFVVFNRGRLKAVNPNDKKTAKEGDLEAEVRHGSIYARTAFSLLSERAREKSVEQYATLCGIKSETIVQMAKEFTSHGKKAAVDFYRGAVQHTNGYYAGQAIITLNLLIGNPDWKGGLSQGGGHWHEFGGKPGNVHNFKHPSKFPLFGPKICRDRSYYESSTLFNGYPAKRPWYPFTDYMYQEVIPSAGDGYPYPIKAIFLHKGTPVLACPTGHKQIEILQDVKKIPLLFSCDIIIAETSMYSDYIFPDTSTWERWGTPHTTPAMLTAVSKVRQPVVAPLVEITQVDGIEMPINMEAILIAIGKKLKLPGIGKNAFGPGSHLDHSDDWYMKAVANIAVGDKKGDKVPAASQDEMDLFLKARSHLPKSVFDPARMKRAAGEKYWPHIVYILNRGGRFEDSHKSHKGNKQAHPYKGIFVLYVEKVAMAKNSMSGENFDGLPKQEPILYANGKPVLSNGSYPLQLITYKEILGGHSRTAPPDKWLGELLDENAVLINRKDARQQGFKDGEEVRISSPTNPKGSFELGNGETRHITGKIKVLEGLRPGVVAISWHFGHWAYGSRDVQVDGKTVKGDPRRARGIPPNPLMLEDTVVGNVCLTDPIGGSASFFDTPVRIERV